MGDANQSPATQIVMLQCTTAGGRTKGANEQAVGTEDVKVTAMNMYKYKEGLRCANVGRVAFIFQQN